MAQPTRDRRATLGRRAASLVALVLTVGLLAACDEPTNGTLQDTVGTTDGKSASELSVGRILGSGAKGKPAVAAPTTSATGPTTTESGKAVGGSAGKSTVPAAPTTTESAEIQALRRRRAATTTSAPTTTAAPVAKPTTTTAAPPKAGAAPTAPTGVIVSVADHGAVPNDDRDDQDAIQATIDAAPAGSTVVFPAGTYQHSALINVRTDGVKLWGYGATLVGTTPTKHAIILRANNTSISGFTLLASPTVRLSAEEQMGIVLHYNNGSTIRDNVVNGTSSAGIFIWGASNYQVLNNTVENTKSDGIHSVGGANNGLVEGNTLRNVGDDCFAVISYIAELDISNHITIRNNSCVGGKARGVSVVGGSDVLIQGNTIEASGAAGIYLASEPSYNTYAAKRITVIGNTLRGVNTNPAIRHGAIFIWGRAGSATTEDGTSYTLQNEDLLIKGNNIIDTVGGAAGIVAQGSYSYRVNFVGNQTHGSLRHSYIELSGDQYNMVDDTHNDSVLARIVGNASILP